MEDAADDVPNAEGGVQTSPIDQFLRAAAEGSRESAAEFFALFMHTLHVVPTKDQTEPFKNIAIYPNNFLNVLAITDKDRILVPAFSEAQHMNTWSSGATKSRTMTGRDLLNILPNDWWVIFNPGQELAKELSPWEISKLRGGIDGINEVLDDLFPKESIRPFEIGPLDLEKHAQLITGLKAAGATLDGVGSIFLAREHGENELGEELETILIGVVAASPQISEGELNELSDQVRAAAERSLIGDPIPLKVFAGTSLNNLTLELFRGLEPIYVQASPKRVGWFEKFVQRFK